MRKTRIRFGLLIMVGLLTTGFLAGCGTNPPPYRAHCQPGNAQTDVNSVKQGDTLHVYNPGAGCQVRFTNGERQVTVALLAKDGAGKMRVYTSRKLTAAVDGAYDTRLRVPKTVPLGDALVGIHAGVVTDCVGPSVCTTPYRSISILTATGFPPASMTPNPAARG